MKVLYKDNYSTQSRLWNTINRALLPQDIRWESDLIQLLGRMASIGDKGQIVNKSTVKAD